MWRELISELTRDEEPIGDLRWDPDFAPGARPEQIEDLERVFGVRPSESLTSLLQESNGVHVCFGTPLVFSVEEIIRTNCEMREGARYRDSWIPFDRLLFFGGAGVDGILFAFPIIAGRIDRDRVYAWVPIEDSCKWQADSLRKYIEWSLGGKLSM
jgi:hypothetical protein